ncbi:MAG: serine hydrolase domain-containing protein [Gemmatimonadales bacterium]
MRSLASALLLLSAPACSAEGVGPGGPATDAELQAELDAWAASSRHYGVSAAIVFPDGREWVGTAGRAGDGPLRAEHLLSIASITKTMTGAVVLRLVEAGALSLDDTIGRWLPPHANVDPAITVRQLLNHTSGVANYTGTEALANAIVADPARRFTIDELLDFVGPPSFAPGERTQYTNTAFLLLARIAEQATGDPMLALYRRHLWEPLDLSEIFLPGAMPPPGPVPHSLAPSGVVDPLDWMASLTAANAAFGLMASARTVARWGHALFAGSVLTPATQAAMRVLVPAAGNIPGETGAGLGIRSYRYLGRVQYGHSGGSAFGSSLLLFDPESGVTVVVAMNQRADADHFVLAPRLLELATAR